MKIYVYNKFLFNVHAFTQRRALFSKSNQTFTATYKKDLSDLASNKNIEISYKSSIGGGKLTEEIDKANPQKNLFHEIW